MSIKNKEDFYAFTIEHPHLNTVREELLDIIVNPIGNPIVLVHGPTGVGKTTLLDNIAKELITTNDKSPGHVPVVTVEVKSTGKNAGFRWADFYHDLLVELKDPLLSRAKLFDCTDWPADYEKRGEGKLRRVLEKALIHRRPKAILIDEAQHMCYLTRRKSILRELDVLKSLSSRVKIPIIMFGTYDVLTLSNLSAQLGRRCKEIHFQRYDPKDEVATFDFADVAENLFERLPFESVPSIDENFEFIYERTCGCVGILKTWLNETVKRFSGSVSSLSIQMLEKTAFPQATCLAIANEIAIAEEKIKERPEVQLEIRYLLGLEKRPIEGRPSEEPLAAVSGENFSASTSTSKKSSPNKKPGERKIKRDRCG